MVVVSTLLGYISSLRFHKQRPLQVADTDADKGRKNASVVTVQH